MRARGCPIREPRQLRRGLRSQARFPGTPPRIGLRRARLRGILPPGVTRASPGTRLAPEPPRPLSRRRERSRREGATSSQGEVMGAWWIRLAALSCLLAPAALAQEASVFIVIENADAAELVLQVEDQVCENTAFDGFVEGSSILTVGLCADEHGWARVLMTNLANGQVSQRSVASGGAVVAP